MSDVADWIAALASTGALAVAGYAANIGLSTFRQQRTASDVELSLGIFADINRYWDRICDSGDNYEYNIGQILAHFEIAASLFNKKVLTEQARLVLSDHLIEVFSSLQASPEGKSLMARCRSADATFSEIKCFLRENLPQALSTMNWQEKQSTTAEI